MERPRWHEALAYAGRVHAGQTRRDGRTPYAAHVSRVTLIVAAEFGCTDGEVLAAAALHDTIEDTPADYDDIESRFGDAVAALVAALSKDMTRPYKDREAAYEAALKAGDWRVKLIKLADTLDNLRDRTGDGVSEGRARRALDRARTAIELAQADAGAGEDPLRTAIRVVAAAAERAADAGP